MSGPARIISIAAGACGALIIGAAAVAQTPAPAPAPPAVSPLGIPLTATITTPGYPAAGPADPKLRVLGAPNGKKIHVLPATLAGLVAGTGLARPTAHRLAVALEHHRLVARDMQGRFVLGPRLAELSAAAGEDRLLATAGPVLARLRDITDPYR